MKFEKSINKIVYNELCSGCATCYSICPKEAIKINHSFPYISVTDQCIDCGLCSKVCPSVNSTYNSGSDFDNRLGKYITCISGYSCSSSERLNGASGGMVTALLHYLLDSKQIDKVAIVSQTNENADIQIISNSSDLVKSQKSKYLPIPINQVLKSIHEGKDTYAFVGTPCQIQGLYNLMNLWPDLKKKIVIKIGIFCGYALKDSSINVIKNYLNIDKENWKFRGWRNGEYPGYVQFEERNTNIKSLCIYNVYDLVVPSYSLKRCRMCPDGLNEMADIAFGDWHDAYDDNLNMGIVRTSVGEKNLKECADNGYLHYNSISKEVALDNTIGAVIEAKRINSEYYREYVEKKRGKEFVPNVTVSSTKRYVSRYKAFFIRNQVKLYEKMSSPKLIKFMEKHPRILMKVGRYVYRYPQYNIIVKLILKVRNMFR